MPHKIHWLDCNENKPKLLKKKYFTALLPHLEDMIAVRNGTDELIMAVHIVSGIYCYNTSNKSLKWEVRANLPEMRKDLHAMGLTTDGLGYLFVSDGKFGNKCIQIFSVSDGQYLGCLIKEGEQGLGYPSRICWHSASHSLFVAHSAGPYWHLSMISME